MAPGPYGPYVRTVIFSTPVIEFGVTFDNNLVLVIESGIAWQVYYDYKLNCIVMGNDYVAQSNIAQRCGRVGRNAPGTCYAMYTKKKYDSLKVFEDPKIITSAIDKEMLDILNICRSRMNVNDSTTEFKESN